MRRSPNDFLLTLAGLRVRFTPLDARLLEFRVTLIANGCCAVNVQPGDGERAIAALRARGGGIVECYDSR